MEALDYIKEITKERIKVMQAFVEGKAVQYRKRENGAERDYSTTFTPLWQWDDYDYRVAEDQSESNPHKEVKMFGLYQCAVRIDDVVRIDTEWDGENNNLVIYQKSVKEPLTVRYRSHEECEKVYLKLLEACNSKK